MESLGKGKVINNISGKIREKYFMARSNFSSETKKDYEHVIETIENK